MPTVADFLSSIGVNTHVDATTSPYGNVGLVAKSLAYLGVTHIRDHAWDTDLPAYTKLAAKGIKFDLIVDDSPKESVTAMTPIRSSIETFEGANEVDINKTSVAAALAQQKALHDAVKSDPLLRSIPIINESVGSSDNYAAYAATCAYSDMMNMHAYAAWGDAPRFVIPDIITSERSPTKPSVVTETGYFTMLNNTVDPSGVTESVQARFTLDTLFDNFSMGVTRTYLYELLDEGADPGNTNSELHYGLFHADGTPKLAATALHNLGAILATPGAAKNPAVTINPTLLGLPETGNSLQLTGKDGSSFLAVWDEPQIWNTDAQTERPVSTNHVTVNLGKVVGSVRVFDPTVGSKPIATYTNISKLVLDITDHPLIVEASGSAQVPITPLSLAIEKALTPAGSTIVDAARGAVLTGSRTSPSSFFVDATNQNAVNRTIVNLHKGDTVTIWGYAGGLSSLSWKGRETANGYTGATLHANLDGTATGPKASVTLAGLSLRDVSSKLNVSSFSLDGGSYLRITDVG